MKPTISIALPVFNGQNYLGDCIESILAQDFTDYELIVSDNASTDATQDIARDFASKDPRIKYHRNPKNIGPEGNYNQSFQHARGEYFMWVAHDDLIEPCLLNRCVSALKDDPGAVLSHSLVRIIDEKDNLLGVYDGALSGAESEDLVDRFRALVMSRHLCTELYGVIRTDALRKTQLLQPYFGSDRVLLVELALIGRFARVPEYLFSNREHTERATRVTFSKEKDTSRESSSTTHHLATWALYHDYRLAVATHVGDVETRRRCLRIMPRWWITDWNLARLMIDIIATVYPDIRSLVYRLKIRFYGSLPQLKKERQ